MVTRKQVEHRIDEEVDVGDPAPASAISGHVNKKGAKSAGRSITTTDSTAPPAATGPLSRKGRKGKKMAGLAATANDGAGAGGAASRVGAGGVGSGSGSGSGSPHRGEPGPPAAQVIVRSEEQLRAIPQTRQLGRVRLHKTVVTENVTREITVRREEIRIDRGAGTDTAPAVVAGSASGPGTASGVAVDGSELEDGGYSIVLHEERPVVRMEAIAVKRIRFTKEMILDEETLSADVRKEVIDTGSRRAIDGAAQNNAQAARSTDDYAG